MKDDHAMTQHLSQAELQERLRAGVSFDPDTPGLKEAAHAVFGLLIEDLEGREIIYVCHVPRLVLVKYVELDDEGFRLIGLTTHHLGSRITPLAGWGEYQAQLDRCLTKAEWRAVINSIPPDPRPVDIGARWNGLELRHGAIGFFYSGTKFYPDSTLVARVRAAAERGEPWRGVAADQRHDSVE